MIPDVCPRKICEYRVEDNSAPDGKVIIDCLSPARNCIYMPCKECGEPVGDRDDVLCEACRENLDPVDLICQGY